MTLDFGRYCTSEILAQQSCKLKETGILDYGLIEGEKGDNIEYLEIATGASCVVRGAELLFQPLSSYFFSLCSLPPGSRLQTPDSC